MQVVTETSVDQTCRANSIIGVQTSNQTTDFRVQAPDGVAPGETFDIVLQPYLSEVPTSASGATTARSWTCAPCSGCRTGST